MANEDKKDFNAMLHKKSDMPKIQILTDPDAIRKFGGEKMFFAPALTYNDIMKNVPKGKLITVATIREYLAKENDADFTEAMTAGIFISICAWASYQRTEDKIPYWRTLKTKGELNPKYPGGIALQKEKLIAEGHIIIERGRKNIRYYVENYDQSLFNLNLLK